MATGDNRSLGWTILVSVSVYRIFVLLFDFCLARGPCAEANICAFVSKDLCIGHHAHVISDCISISPGSVFLLDFLGSGLLPLDSPPSYPSSFTIGSPSGAPVLPPNLSLLRLCSCIPSLSLVLSLLPVMTLHSILNACECKRCFRSSTRTMLCSCISPHLDWQSCSLCFSWSFQVCWLVLSLSFYMDVHIYDSVSVRQSFLHSRHAHSRVHRCRHD